MRGWLAVVAGSLVLAVPRQADACPGCYPAQEARARIASDPDILLHASGALLPFLLTAVIALLLHRVGRSDPRPRRLSTDHMRDGS